MTEQGNGAETTRAARSTAKKTRALGLRGFLILGICTALLFFALASNRAPRFVVDLLDSDSITELTLRGGSRIDFGVEGGTATQEVTAAVAQALHARGAVVANAHNSQIRVELAETDPSSARAWAERMSARGEFALHIVLENSEFMKTAYNLASESSSVSGEIDTWFHDERGQGYEDYYLQSENPDEIVAALNGWLDEGLLTLPAETMIGFERMNPYGEEEAGWRTYLLYSNAEMTGADVESAKIYWNPTSNNPEILLEFTDEGGQRFANITGELVGRKIAILFDGVVNMAPTVQDRIAGGSTSISLGGNDPAVMQAEAQGFVGALSGPDLPASVQILSVDHVEPQVSNFRIRLARGLLALGIGLGIAALALVFTLLLNTITVASSRPRITALPKSERPSALAIRPLLVSIGGILATLAIGTRWLPGAKQLYSSPFYGTDLMPSSPPPGLSWLAIGLMPFLVGAVLAEGIACLIPAWRKRRGGIFGNKAGTSARLPIHNLGLALGLALLAAQAFFVTEWMRPTNDVGPIVMSLMPPSENSQRAAVLALLAGSALLYAIAKLISRYGLGNGFAVVIMAGYLPLLPDALAQLEELSVADVGLFSKVFVTLALAILATYFLVRRSMQTPSANRLALPLAGVAPLLIGPEILGAFVLAGHALKGQMEELITQGLEHLQDMQFGSIVVASALITAIALRTSRSKIRVVAGANNKNSSKSLVIAVFISLAFPAMLYFAIVSNADAGIGALIPLMTLVLGTGLAMDLASEFWARVKNPQLVAVWPLQSPRDLQSISSALEATDIEFYVRGRFLRTLLSVVGPFVPMVIMVPRPQAKEARKLITSQLVAAVPD
tara:strand:- start:22748 stop:25282 length:2535 start_codon:yes stop_codon:yes gene_type:complete